MPVGLTSFFVLYFHMLSFPVCGLLSRMAWDGHFLQWCLMLQSQLIRKLLTTFKVDEKGWCDALSVSDQGGSCTSGFQKWQQKKKKKTLFLDAFLLKKKFLLLIKDLIANLMMASDMSMILLLPSGHTASLQLIWWESQIHYLCTLLGDIYDMSAGRQDGLLTSSFPPVPV